MDAARAGGLAESVVGVVLVMGKDPQPAADQAGRHRLRPHMHQPPLVQQIVAQVHPSVVNRVENVLHPRHQQPDDGAFFLGHSPQNPLRLHTAQQHGLASGDERAEPVHLGPRVVKGRNAEKHVLPGLAVVLLLHDAGLGQGLVGVQDGLWKARGARGEIDGRVVLRLHRHRGSAGGAIAHHLDAVLGVVRAAAAHKKLHPQPGVLPLNCVHPLGKLRAEHQHLHIRQVQAVANLLAGIAKVHGHCHAAGLEDAEIYRQILQAVHHQNCHLGAPLQPPAQQQIGKAVGLAVKVRPAHLPAIGGVRPGGLDQPRLPPGDCPVQLLGRTQLYQRALAAPQPRVPFQKIRDYHAVSLSSQAYYFSAKRSVSFAEEQYRMKNALLRTGPGGPDQPEGGITAVPPQFAAQSPPRPRRVCPGKGSKPHAVTGTPGCAYFPPPDKSPGACSARGSERYSGAGPLPPCTIRGGSLGEDAGTLLGFFIACDIAYFSNFTC